jgi:hypothetical protein
MRKRDLYCRALAFFRSPFPAVRCSLFVCVSICLCFLWLTAARLLKHAVAMPQIRTGLPLPSGRGISLVCFFGEKCVIPINVSPRWDSIECCCFSYKCVTPLGFKGLFCFHITNMSPLATGVTPLGFNY